MHLSPRLLRSTALLCCCLLIGQVYAQDSTPTTTPPSAASTATLLSDATVTVQPSDPTATSSSDITATALPNDPTATLSNGALVTTPTSELAETPSGTPVETPSSGCDIDLDTAIIALGEARTNATKGDQDAALKIIHTVRQQLEDIETLCAAPSNAIDLPETYTAPNNAFTIHYPAGWTTSEFKEGKDWVNMLAPMSPTLPIPVGGSVVFSNLNLQSGGDPSTVLSSSPQTGSYIFVSVGNPLHILESTGLYNQDFAQTFVDGGFTLNVLSGQFLVALSTSNAVPSMSQIKTNPPTLALDLRDTSAQMYLLLVELNKDENLYALLIGVATETEKADIAPLMAAIADTLKAPEQ